MSVLKTLIFLAGEVYSKNTRKVKKVKNNPRKVKKSKHSKLRHSKKSDEEKALYFKAQMNITPSNHTFILENSFRLLWCSQLMVWDKPYILTRYIQRVLTVIIRCFVRFLFYSSYCNTFISVEINITLIY